jgi:hypothetical protein
LVSFGLGPIISGVVGPEFIPTVELREAVAGVATGSEGPQICSVALLGVVDPVLPTRGGVTSRPRPSILSGVLEVSESPFEPPTLIGRVGSPQAPRIASAAPVEEVEEPPSPGTIVVGTVRKKQPKMSGRVVDSETEPASPAGGRLGRKRPKIISGKKQS